MGIPILVSPGDRYGRLEVIREISPAENGRRRVECRCDCGTIVPAVLSSIRTGNTSSCGCLRREMVAAKNFKHGYREREEKTGRKTRTEYTIWKRMRSRCNDVNDRKYPEYGGRGIQCCERWNDFALFLEDMGDRPSVKYSLDRFPDVNGNYEPGNVRWATATEQARNKRNNRTVEWNGKRMTVAELSERTGVSYCALLHRISKGWTVERAVSTPVRLGRNQFSGA